MFDRVVCLNIDKRLDQQQRIRDEFHDHGLTVEFFVAGDGKTASHYDRVDTDPPPRSGYPAWMNRPNSWNAFQCFRQIVEKAKVDGVSTLLLLEDDATPTTDFAGVFPLAYFELPADWDMFYLGANYAFARTEMAGKYLLRMHGGGCWHAVCLRYTVFDAVLDLPMDGPIDGMCEKYILPKYKCFGCWPNVVVTLPGYSHCEGRNVDYREFFTRRA